MVYKRTIKDTFKVAALPSSEIVNHFNWDFINEIYHYYRKHANMGNEENKLMDNGAINLQIFKQEGICLHCQIPLKCESVHP